MLKLSSPVSFHVAQGKRSASTAAIDLLFILAALALALAVRALLSGPHTVEIAETLPETIAGTQE
jgi:hypothetical protein